MLNAIKFRKFSRLESFARADDECLFALVNSYGYHQRLLSLVINRGANVNAQDALGYTPLMHLILNAPLVSHVKELLSNGADFQLKNCYGDDALQLSLRANKPTSITYLLYSRGANFPLSIELNYAEWDLFFFMRRQPDREFLYTLIEKRKYRSLKEILPRCDDVIKNDALSDSLDPRAHDIILDTQFKFIQTANWYIFAQREDAWQRHYSLLNTNIGSYIKNPVDFILTLSPSRYHLQYLLPWRHNSFQDFLQAQFYSNDDVIEFFSKNLRRPVEGLERLNLTHYSYQAPFVKLQMTTFLLIVKYEWTYIPIEIAYHIFSMS